MDNDELIRTEIICTHYHIEHEFISSLSAAGLIELTSVEEEYFLHPSQLQDLEKYCNLHYELDINIEGLEAIAHMLHRMSELQSEVNVLRQQLMGLKQLVDREHL